MIERPTTPAERKLLSEASRPGQDVTGDPAISRETLWDKYRGFSMADLYAMKQILLDSIRVRSQHIDQLLSWLTIHDDAGEDEQSAFASQVNELSRLKAQGTVEQRGLSVIGRLIMYRFEHGPEMPGKWKDLTEEDREKIGNPPDKRERWKKRKAEVRSVCNSIMTDHPKYGQGEIIAAIQTKIWPDGEAPSEATIRRYLGWR